MATTRVSAPAGVPFIDVERDFDAPRDLLYRAWTEPDLLVQWLGPRQYRMEIDVWEPRDGGRYRYTHSDDAGNVHGFRGVFHGTPTTDHMLQTFEYEGAPGHVSLDALTFEDLGAGRTRVRTHSTFQSVEARNAMVESGMEAGMNEGFDRLDELLARLLSRVGAGH
jgi:uncharacterized protein YndB with AHSA1/START domain